MTDDANWLESRRAALACGEEQSRLQGIIDALVLHAVCRRARPKSDWHEDVGPVLWWKFPIVEPPYCGTPLDLEIADYIGQPPKSAFPSYVTHWTPIIPPNDPEPEARNEQG